MDAKCFVVAFSAAVIVGFGFAVYGYALGYRRGLQHARAYYFGAADSE